MHSTELKEMILKLPGDIVKTITSKEIILMLSDKALSKSEYYGTRCKEFEGKYGMDFASFKKKVEESEEEILSEWDDLLLWEGYELAHKEWQDKHEELKNCIR